MRLGFLVAFVAHPFRGATRCDNRDCEIGVISEQAVSGARLVYFVRMAGVRPVSYLVGLPLNTVPFVPRKDSRNSIALLHRIAAAGGAMVDVTEGASAGNLQGIRRAIRMRIVRGAAALSQCSVVLGDRLNAIQLRTEGERVFARLPPDLECRRVVTRNP